MRIRFFLFLLILSISKFSSIRANKLETLKNKGFVEFANASFLKTNYNCTYADFDKFIDAMTVDKEFSQKIRASEKEFLNDLAQKKRYCSAPPSYRNPKEDSTKRHNKIYFQFIADHYRLLKNRYAGELANKPEVLNFLAGMAKIDRMAKEMFAQILEKFEIKLSGIKKLFYGNHNELTVITKIVRYEKAEPDRWGTTAHYDKSGLSLIWDSNDDDDDSLLICEDMQHPCLEKLIKPKRKFSHKKNLTSAIMITGSALSKLGINMKPTLHGVAPIKKHHRFAVISFLLIPDIDMSDLKTDFEPNM